MVEIVRTPTVAETGSSRFCKTITWSGLLGTDSGQMIDLEAYPDKTIHVFGTFGGGTVTFYGSNDPKALTDRVNGTLFGSKTADYEVLTDTLNNTLVFTTAGLKQILEDPLYILPVVTGGTGSNLTIIVKSTRGRP